MLRPAPSHKRGAAAVVMLFAGIATGACSLFVSTDGLTSPGETSAADTGTTDVSNETALLVDARAENAIDTGPMPFCVANAFALFCDDFDNGALGATWDSQQTADGTISLTGAHFESSPYSALFKANGSGSVVQLERRVPAAAGNFRVAFSFRLAAAPSSASAFQILARIANGKGAQLELYEDKDSFSINDRINGSYGTFYSSVPGIAIGTWVDFVMHVTLAPSGGTSSASIDIDGITVVPTFDIAAAFNAPSGVDLALGLPFDTGTMTTLAIDNVALFSE